MKSSIENKVLVALIAIGVLAALFGVKSRFSVESHNQRTEIVIDYSDALDLALAARQPLDSVLAQLRKAGVTTLALWEDPLDSMRTEGAMNVHAVSPTDTQLTFSASFPGQQERVVAALKNKTSVTFTVTGNLLDVRAPYNQIQDVGIGLEQGQIQTAVNDGFLISPRVYNYSGVTPQSIQWMLDQVKTGCQGRANVVIFNGADVLGNRGLIDATATSLRNDGLLYGSLELGKQIGDQDLSRIGDDLTVRVHSIGGNEMPTMDEPTAVARFALAARERNIRSCYVRLFQNGLEGQPDVLQANVQYITDIVQGLHDGGIKIGAAHPFSPDPRPKRILLALMGIGIAAGGVLLLRQFIPMFGMTFWTVLGVSLVIGLFLATRETTMMGRLIVALVAAMSFPTLGFLLNRPPRNAPVETSPFRALEMAFRKYELITLWTIIGVILLVGVLSDLLMILKVFEFVGIRVAIIAPLLLVLLHHGLGLDELDEDATWAERKAMVSSRFRAVASSPVLMGQLFFGLVGLALVGLLVLRSGNDPGIGVSSSERSFRAILNKVLYVRPRTKEFLFGHPLFVMGLALYYSGNRKWYLLFACAGAVAQASLLDTFCHLHTPLLISFLRATDGWILGLVLGVVLFFVLRRFFPRDAETAAI